MSVTGYPKVCIRNSLLSRAERDRRSRPGALAEVRWRARQRPIRCRIAVIAVTGAVGDASGRFPVVVRMSSDQLDAPNRGVVFSAARPRMCNADNFLSLLYLHDGVRPMAAGRGPRRGGVWCRMYGSAGAVPPLQRRVVTCPAGNLPAVHDRAARERYRPEAECARCALWGVGTYPVCEQDHGRDHRPRYDHARGAVPRADSRNGRRADFGYGSMGWWS